MKIFFEGEKFLSPQKLIWIISRRKPEVVLAVFVCVCGGVFFVCCWGFFVWLVVWLGFLWFVVFFVFWVFWFSFGGFFGWVFCFVFLLLSKFCEQGQHGNVLWQGVDAGILTVLRTGNSVVACL